MLPSKVFQAFAELFNSVTIPRIPLEIPLIPAVIPALTRFAPNTLLKTEPAFVPALSIPFKALFSRPIPEVAPFSFKSTSILTFPSAIY